MKVMLKKKERICYIFLDSTCTGNVSDFAVLPAVMYVVFSIYSLVTWKGMQQDTLKQITVTSVLIF